MISQRFGGNRIIIVENVSYSYTVYNYVSYIRRVMFRRIKSAMIYGLNAQVVDVEVDIGSSLPPLWNEWVSGRRSEGS